MSRYADTWPPTEDKLAKEFVSFFSLNYLIETELFHLCKKIQVEICFAPLPEGLYGINGRHGSKRQIVLSTNQTVPGGKAHTLLHELRELLEYTFCDLGRPTVVNASLEERAESFAHAARMDGAHKAFMMFLGEASKVQVNWQRWLAYAATVVFGFAHVALCGMHSQFEDAIVQSRRKRVG